MDLLATLARPPHLRRRFLVLGGRSKRGHRRLAEYMIDRNFAVETDSGYATCSMAANGVGVARRRSIQSPVSLCTEPPWLAPTPLPGLAPGRHVHEVTRDTRSQMSSGLVTGCPQRMARNSGLKTLAPSRPGRPVCGVVLPRQRWCGFQQSLRSGDLLSLAERNRSTQQAQWSVAPRAGGRRRWLQQRRSRNHRCRRE